MLWIVFGLALWSVFLSVLVYSLGKDKGTQEGYYLGKQEAKKADPKFKEIKRKK